LGKKKERLCGTAQVSASGTGPMREYKDVSKNVEGVKKKKRGGPGGFRRKVGLGRGEEAA